MSISNNPYRTHTCNQLTSDNIGNNVTLSGWIHSKRDHGGVLFIDIRDHYGITQIVFDENNNKELTDVASHIKNESVITIKGEVKARSKDTINHKLPTGNVEVHASSLHVESAADQIPFQVNDEQKYPENLRLKYRFLDLRREKMHKNIMLRSQIISHIRNKMTENGFLEMQTPILTSSSPEGARDFVVPSRLHPGKFYALPQAPQQFKQLLMVSGFDKYFQIAPCFRDEDSRADRSPGEFYQLDMEMAFPTQDEIFAITEDVVLSTFEKFGNKKVTKNLPRITYKDSMLKYGSDKPDLRIPIEISDTTEAFRDSDFSIFKKNIDSGGVVRAIPAKGTADKPRSFFDKMIEFAQGHGAPGLGYINFSDTGEAKGPIAKFLSEDRIKMIQEKTGASNGDSVFFSSGKELDAAKIAGEVRKHLGNILGLIDKNVFEFCWIVDFPYFEYNEDKKGIDFSHNPFSMPQGELDALESNDPLTILAYQYDLVCNGIELSSGAIRNHKPEIMYKAFEIAGYSKEDVDNKFGAVITSFKFGAPPHGGIAPGVDRMIMLITDEENIREVVCFPMNQQAEDLMMSAPSEISTKHLKELSIKLDLKEKDNKIKVQS